MIFLNSIVVVFVGGIYFIITPTVCTTHTVNMADVETCSSSIEGVSLNDESKQTNIATPPPQGNFFSTPS